MNKRNTIEIGDIVHVDFNNAQFTLCSKAEGFINAIVYQG